MKKKILLSGINGFLGSVFASRLKQKNFDVLCPVKLQLDVSKKNDWQTFLKHNDFDFILHFAGCKDVKKLEDDFGFAVEQNAKWVKNLDYAIENVEKKKVKCLFFSSDYVFDALEGKCSENTPPKSKTNYGKSKILAEKWLLESKNIDFKIIRIQSVIGKGSAFLDWLIDSILKGNTLKMLTNSNFYPTPIGFVFDSVEKVISDYEKISQNIIHISSFENAVSRFDFAKKISEFFPKNKAKILPLEELEGNCYLNFNASLTPSKILDSFNLKTFEDYMKEELKKYV